MNRASEEVIKRQHELPDYFVDAHGIDAKGHLRVLAAAQKHVCNSISKTLNGPSDDTVESVRELYELAYNSGVKAVSYYRDGSRDNQVLVSAKNVSQEPISPNTVQPESNGHGIPEVIPSVYVQKVIDRPKELSGWTWQIPFEGQNLYVTVNHDSNKILEVLCTGAGVSGGVGRLASMMLRSYGRVSDVVKALNKEIGTHSVWFNTRCCTSPEQAVAECLNIAKRRLKGLSDSEKESVPVLEVGGRLTLTNEYNSALVGYYSIDPNAIGPAGLGFFEQPITQGQGTNGRLTRPCPDCKTCNLTTAGGCDFCPGCGWSKCK